MILAIVSALVVVPTYKYPSWTGLRYGGEIGFGLGILMLVIFALAFRKHRDFFLLMIANLIGISIGAGIAKVLHRVEMGREIGLSVFFVPVIAVGGLFFLYVRSARALDKLDQDLAKIDDEFANFTSLPDQEKAALLEEWTKPPPQTSSSPGFGLLSAILVTCCALLSGVSLLTGRAGPVMIILNMFITMGAIFLWWFYWQMNKPSK